MSLSKKQKNNAKVVMTKESAWSWKTLIRLFL
jgi:hypothetical protein